MTFEQLAQWRPTGFDVRNQLPFHVRDAALAAAGASARARAAVVTLEDLRHRQEAVRAGIAASLGGLPPRDTPLQARTVGVLGGDGYRLERVIFEPRPDVPVTANLYVPDGLSAPTGAVLLLCGHREPAKHHDEYQTVCLFLASVGLVVLCIDPFGQGERLGYYDPATGQASVTSVWEHERLHRQCLPLGDGVARYMLHDALRALDYLRSRPEVDPRRIGVSGHSGGGTQTALVMLHDAGIAAAAPGAFLMGRPFFLLTGKTQDGEQRWPGFSAMGFDHEDALLAMAPRPVLLVATTSDQVPIEAPRHLVAVCRRFWELHDHGADLQLAEDEGGHRFSVPLARAAARFFAQHLLGRSVQPPETVRLHPAEALWCTRSGQVQGEIPGARNVHQEIVARLQEVCSAREARSDRREQAEGWLRAAVLRGRRPVPPNPREHPAGTVEGLAVNRSIWFSQEGLVNCGVWLRPADRPDEALPLSVGIWDGGLPELPAHRDWIRRTCAAGRAVLACNVTAVGSLLPHHEGDPLGPFGILDRYTDELVWLGDSMAALRTFDLLQALAMARAVPGVDARDIRLFGAGRHAVYALLAALLDPAVRGVQTLDALESLAAWVARVDYDWADSQSFILPGMLRHFDLPDLGRWLADDGRAWRKEGAR